MSVQREASVTVAAPPESVFAFVDDLGRYPEWTHLVARAEALSPGSGPPGWAVDLRGQFGPLARSKRLRMIRARHEPPSAVVFERDEADGRPHAAWTLTAEVTAEGDGSHVKMTFHYGGGLWGPVVERLLGDEIEVSSARLAALVEAR